MSLLHLRRQRRLRQKLFPRRGAAPPRPRPPPAAGRADDESIGAEGFLVEKERRAAGPETSSDPRPCPASAASADGSMPMRLHQAERFLAVRERRLDAGRPAVGDPQLAAGTELVALGVAAEVVVVVEDQHARLRAGARAVEIRGGEAADAAADDDEVVGLAGVDRAGRPPPRTGRRAAVRRRRTIRRGCRACRSAPADSSRACPARTAPRRPRSTAPGSHARPRRRRYRSRRPFRKSRRVIARSMPSSRSRAGFRSWSSVIDVPRYAFSRTVDVI